MSQESIDRQVREYYENQRLSPEALTNIRAMIRGGRQDTPPLRRSRRWMHVLMAAGLTGILVAGILWGIGRLPGLDAGASATEVANRVANEAAICHNQNLDVEFRAKDYIDLRSQMDRLAFHPVEPERFHGQGMVLIGARYTMIHGQPAVQLVLEGPDGRICTLYQARPAADLASLSSSSRQVDGLAIELWQEKGLVMVLARPMS